MNTVITIIKWAGGTLAFVTLTVILIGLIRGAQRKVGRVQGYDSKILHSPWAFLFIYVLYFVICYLGWSPLPWMIFKQTNFWLLGVGSLFFFPGMALVLWGRLSLGKNYFVSTGLGAQLFSGHQLVTGGPYAFVRHPMYLGMILAFWGSLLIYGTWTTLFLVCTNTPAVIIRSRREEKVLAAEFGELWQEYCRRVPAFIPRLFKMQITKD